MHIFKTSKDNSGDDFSLLGVVQAHDFYSYLVENYSQKNPAAFDSTKIINASIFISYGLSISEHDCQGWFRGNLLDTL